MVETNKIPAGLHKCGEYPLQLSVYIRLGMGQGSFIDTPSYYEMPVLFTYGNSVHPCLHLERKHTVDTTFSDQWDKLGDIPV